MEVDPSQLQVEPSYIKLWRFWSEWFDGLPFWDPWGAAIALVLAGFTSGYFFWKMMNQD